MRCKYCNEILFKDDLPKKKHEDSCGLNPKYKIKKCTCKKPIEDWTFHKYKKCVRCGVNYEL